MKKLAKVGIALALIGTIGGVATATAVSTSAAFNPGISRNDPEISERRYYYEAEHAEKCNGQDIIKDWVSKDRTISYSDGYFEQASKYYNDHMATTSMILASESDNYVSVKDGEKDYSNGARDIIRAYQKIGFYNVYASQSYKEKPTIDSIGCAIAMKKLTSAANKDKKVVAITVRSAGYDSEWASNVKLGKSGEAEGFADAANQVVDKYLEEFIEQRNLQADLAAGNVKFWITGFSRGGATANLAAKRLIDKYQEAGNEVYAYCLEAPRGGVKEEIKPERNYDGIHNVVNPGDLVPYVAPANYGFIRYGVDHYLIGSPANYEKMVENRKNRPHFAQDVDNMMYLEGTPEYNEQKEKVLTVCDARGLDKPYEAKSYVFNADSFSIEENKAYSGISASLNSSIVFNLGQNTSRSEYVDDGYQQAAANLMEFTYKTGGVGIADMINEMTKHKSLFELLPITDILKSLDEVYVTNTGGSDNPFVLAWKTLFDRDDLKFTVRLNDQTINKIADSLVDALFKESYDFTQLFSSKIKDIDVTNLPEELYNLVHVGFKGEELFKEYNGGLAQARKDINAIVKLVLKNVSDVDFLCTIIKNADHLVDNHSTSLTEAWLRSYDSWAK